MVMRLCATCSEAEALPRKKRCAECDLREQPITVRQLAAEERLALVPEAARRQRVAEAEWPAGRRFCAGCETFVSLRDVSPSGSRCQTCTQVAAYASRLKSEFGMTWDEYMALLHVQGGRCAICRQRPVSKRLAVDHEHSTGTVRGLLCSSCNGDLLPAARHVPETLENAAYYLRVPPAQGEWSQPELLRGEPEPIPF